jgi:SAM-dependent methyltransferase
VADPIPTSYDEMPYINKAFPQTHPDRLATLARLFGLQPPDLDTCRVLELGCASGDNLIPMAIELPNARFIGIDLSARQVEQGSGRSWRCASPTSNCASSTSPRSMRRGAFRLHHLPRHLFMGPAPVRERILAICRDNLAPNGVAYISYNTLPGWRIRGMIRDMMVYHSTPFSGAAAKVSKPAG